MSILINEETRFLIQGITGKQGQRACKEMLLEGAKVVAGVTPGRSGQEIENVPVYDSILEAKNNHQIDAAVIFVPPKFAKSAIIEAIEAEIRLINIVTENIPLHDMAYCLALAKKTNCKIIGPTSAGIYSVGKTKCGPIASGKSNIAFSPGRIGVISRSGGMASETSLVLTQENLGQSTVISIGSDVLMGTRYVELIQEFESDPETEGIVIFGEIGGTAEEDLALYLNKRKQQNDPYLKPIIAFISGKFAEGIENVSLGHAGAIIEGNSGKRENKVKVLKEAGVIIAEQHHLIGKLMKKELDQKENKIEPYINNKKQHKTRISKIENNDLTIRGDKLSNLIKNETFSDAVFFLLSSRRPNQHESILFEKILVSIIDHGMGTTSSLSSRTIISGGNSLNVGIAGGILSIGDYHGGAIEKAMQQFYSWKEKENLEDTKNMIRDLIREKKTIYGFGHKVYKEGDPRVKMILQEMKGISFQSQFLYLKDLTEQSFLEIKEKKISLNIDGLIALLLCDFGFDPLLGKGIFVIGRTPGLVAQCHEELKYEKPVRRLKEEEIEYIKD